MNVVRRALSRIPIGVLAMLGSLLLVAGAAAGSWQSEREAHRFAREQLRSNVANLAVLVDRAFAEQRNLVRQLSTEPRLRVLTLALLERPDDPEARAALDARLALQPALKDVDWYTLLDRDFRNIVEADRAFEGKVAGMRDEVRASLLAGETVVLPPFWSWNRGSDGKRLMLQSACAPIDDAGRIVGFQCLSSNPERFLMPVLRTAWTGDSGEAYLIDRNARMRSQGRFVTDELVESAPPEPLMVSPLFARVPEGAGDVEPSALPRPSATDSMTALAAAMVAHPESDPVLQDHYLDYRGVMVSGAGVWLPDIDLGVVVEIDDAEIGAAAHFSQLWLWLLAAGGVAALAVLAVKHGVDQKRIAIREAQLSGFFDNAPASMHLQDAKGRYLRVNTRYAEFVGLPLDALVGRLEDELSGEIDAGIREDRKREREAVLGSGQTLTFPKTLQHADGRTVHVIVVRFPIRVDAGGAIIGVGSVGFDVTAEVEARQAIEQQADRLESEVAERTVALSEARDAAEAAARAKGDFLATMSHEIRTPLNAILGFTRLAQRVDDPARIADYLQQVLGSGQHLLRLVDDVLDLSRMDVVGLRFDAESFEPETLVADAARLVMPRAAEKGLEILLCAAERGPGRVVGDARRISQILINFLGNAVKFTDTGVVRLRLWHEERADGDLELCVDVEDTGIGIPAEALSGLFQPFQQVHSGRNRPHEGSGLGLAISRRLAEAMGGRVQATSVLGAGSTFSLRLPVRRDPAPATPEPRGVGVRLLVADAHAEAQRRLAEGLRLLGFSVTVADSPVACARARDLAPFDVEVLTLELLAASPPATPTFRRVLLAAASDSLPPGVTVDARLSKPVWPADVARVALELLSLAPGPSRPAPVAPAAEGLVGCRILLVEDNAANQQVAGGLLELEGMVVTVVDDGAEALHRLSGETFDAVLMDLHMPVLDGFEATRLIRRDPRWRSLPVIGLSASVLASDHQACFDAGMNAFVAKPIEPDELLGCLRRLLRPTGSAAAPVPVRVPVATIDGHHPWLAALATQGEFDVPSALRRLMGREALFIGLVEKALRARGDDLSSLRGALEAGDAATMARRLHDFGATAGSLGATSLAGECLRSEAALRERLVEPAALADLVARIERTWAFLATLESA